MEFLLIIIGVALLPAIVLLVVGVIIQWRRGDEILKEIDEFLERNIVEGYEDKDGFHYGKK